MEPQPFEAGPVNRWLPDPPVEVAGPDWLAIAGGEHKVGARPMCQLIFKVSDQEARDSDASRAGGRLRYGSP